MTDEERDQEIARELIRKIEADPSIRVGSLPWRMSESEWAVFKRDPEKFRKERQTTEAEHWQNLKDWVNDSVWVGGREIWKGKGNDKKKGEMK